MKIRQGDTVLVISGKDKGKKGTVLRVLQSQNRVVVGGVNMRTKFTKKSPQAAGQKIQFEAGIAIGNVMMLDPKSGKPTRIGYKIDEKTGRKVRFAKVSGTVIDRASAKSEKKTTDTKEDTAKKSTKKEKPAEVASKKPTKGPFWKKMGFGADAIDGEPDAHAQAGPEHGAPPSAQVHVRGGNRGS